MKKKYMEPVMLVEDFTVSEMVAKNCELKPEEFTIVSYANAFSSCPNGTEWGKFAEKADAYAKLSDAYNNAYDWDGEPHTADYVFTKAFHDYSTSKSGVDSDYICTTDATGMTFHDTIEAILCTADDSVLQNS